MQSIKAYIALIFILTLFGIFVIIAHNKPVFSVFLILVFGYIPTLFLFTDKYDRIQEVFALGFGFNVIDLLLVALLSAVIIKKINYSIIIKNYSGKCNNLCVLLCIFSLLLLFNIIRNLSQFGLSSFGEFRFRYLVLIIPVYIIFFINSKKKIETVFRLVLYVTLVFPIIFIPFIIFNHRIEHASVYRLFGSSVNLGFLYSLITAIIIGQKHIKKRKPSFIVIFFIIAGVVLITDTHRSVWLSALFALLMLVRFKYLNLSRVSIFVIVFTSILIIGLYVLEGFRNIDPVAYLNIRVKDIYTSLDSTSSNTGTWRLVIWKANIVDVYKTSFIFGKGFGGYWNVYVEELGAKVNIFPHNLYIMTLVKLGLVGLVIYILIFIKIYSKFLNKLKLKYRFSYSSNSSRILLVGILIFLVQHIYYWMYSFTYLSLIYIGLFYSIYDLVEE